MLYIGKNLVLIACWSCAHDKRIVLGMQDVELTVRHLVGHSVYGCMSLFFFVELISD